MEDPHGTTDPDPQPVPRALRSLDVVALLLFLAGAGLHVTSWLGMRELRESPPETGADLFAGMERFNRYWELAQTGTWLVSAAVAVAVVAAVTAFLVRRGAESGG